MPRTTSISRDGSSGSPQTRSTTSRSTISERSTLTSLRTPGSTGVVRGDASSPQSALPKSTQSYGRGYYGTYGSSGYSYPWYYGGRSGGYWGGHYGSWGIGWSVGWGIGWGYRPWHIGQWWRPFVYFGSHSIAILGNGAWYIQPYHHGWWGYNYGPRSYFHAHSWRSHHWFSYHGSYCRVTRPYWYGYTRWWDWRPYSYGYTALSYDSLYDDGYDSGYDSGYDRGYEDGAEDVSNYRDNRRRDSIGNSGKRPQPEKDRARGDAAGEYRHEMNRGSDAFAKGDYGTATKAFKEAVILDPSSADARYSLAISAFGQGKYAFSAFALRRGIVLDAERSNIDMAKAFGGPDVLKGYVEHLDGELKDLPEDPDLLLLRGFTALRTGDARTAAAMLDRALAQLPQDAATRALHKEAMEALEGE